MRFCFLLRLVCFKFFTEANVIPKMLRPKSFSAANNFLHCCVYFIKTLLCFLAFAASLFAAAQTANRFDVVITEIMADPTPQVGLPNAEYIEIRNVSSTAFNLNSWHLSDAAGTATITASFVLQPDSAVVLCSNTNAPLLAAYGRAIGVTSFPSLDNDGETLILRSPQNRIIHAVSYTSAWYSNEAKKHGGWSLEMIDPKNPCQGSSNWKASTDPLGGTPARTNSVNGNNRDLTPPQLKRTYTTDSLTAILIFDEPLDSSTASLVANFNVSGNNVVSAICLPPLFDRVQIKLSTPMLSSTVYSISVASIKDCSGNVIGNFNKAPLGIPAIATAGEVVINEILFNPKSGGSDYVELYNRSRKIVDLNRLFLANRNGNGVLSSLVRISDQPFYLFPGEYIAVTEDELNVSFNYLVKNADALIPVSSLPSWPDDKGTVAVVEINNTVIDEVAYEDDWHFALIANPEGVALERIDPEIATQKKDNWTSAASTAGYGTPGYRNSQYKQSASGNGMMDIVPKVFSPDNDGIDDLVAISLKTDGAGYVANIKLFDANGRLVRYLVKNATMGKEGSWNWDGLDDKNARLPIGSYVVHAELFNLEGKKQQWKGVVVLARRLN
jgi:hypothetical protein